MSITTELRPSSVPELAAWLTEKAFSRVDLVNGDAFRAYVRGEQSMAVSDGRIAIAMPFDLAKQSLHHWCYPSTDGKVVRVSTDTGVRFTNGLQKFHAANLGDLLDEITSWDSYEIPRIEKPQGASDCWE